MYPNSTVGDRLLMLRQGKKISQKDLAKALSTPECPISRERVAKWENQKGLIPRPNDIIMLADFYGVSCDYILRGVTPERIALVHDLGLSDNAIEQMEDFKDLYPKAYGFISDMFDMQHGSADYILENIGKAIDVLTDHLMKKAQMLEMDDLDEPTVEIGNGIMVEHTAIVRALVRNACEDFMRNMNEYVELEARKHAKKKHA